MCVCIYKYAEDKLRAEAEAINRARQVGLEYIDSYIYIYI